MPVLRDLFRGFVRGANRHKEMTSKRGNKHFHPNTSRIQATGYRIKLRHKNVKEMIPQIIAPDLTDFPLRPYVSYRCPETREEPVTARNIFEKCIAPQVLEDLKAGKYKETPQSKGTAANESAKPES